MWEFELKSEDGQPITLTVWQGTGRWSHTINTKTLKIGDAVWAYDATVTYPDGTKSQTYITRSNLLYFRRTAKRQALKDKAARNG